MKWTPWRVCVCRGAGRSACPGRQGVRQDGACMVFARVFAVARRKHRRSDALRDELNGQYREMGGNNSEAGNQSRAITPRSSPCFRTCVQSHR